MSYILEALIQAQSERQCHGVPGLYTVQTLPRPLPSPPRSWPLVATGVAGLSSLLALAWLQPWQQNPLRVSAPIITSATVAAPDRQARPAVISMSPQDVIPSVALAQPQPGATERGVAAAIPDAPRRKHHRPVRKGKVKVSTSAGKLAAAPGARIYNIAELPAELQKVARKISISGFAHSDNPKERTAIINDRALRAGEEVSGGLRVERIADDSVIFTLKGYRFRKGRT